MPLSCVFSGPSGRCHQYPCVVLFDQVPTISAEPIHQHSSFIHQHLLKPLSTKTPKKPGFFCRNGHDFRVVFLLSQVVTQKFHSTRSHELLFIYRLVYEFLFLDGYVLHMGVFHKGSHQWVLSSPPALLRRRHAFCPTIGRVARPDFGSNPLAAPRFPQSGRSPSPRCVPTVPPRDPDACPPGPFALLRRPSL